MYAAVQPLQVLEAQALYHLQSVDLATPMEQLHAVFDALIEVPTRERRSDTAFTRQAAVALDTLLERTQTLAALVHLLTEHVSGTALPATTS
jgi:hypothetical protein